MHESILRIKDLQGQLQTLGYHEYQIHSIMREVAGESSIEALPPSDREEVIHNLEEYVCFAQKCWRPTR